MAREFRSNVFGTKRVASHATRTPHGATPVPENGILSRTRRSR